jgi:hypothetical protein
MTAPENDAPDAPAFLAQFLAHNSSARCRQHGDVWEILGPWNDATVSLRVRETDTQLVEALNAVHLPPRFTALWHLDSRHMEVIWTFLPAGSEYPGRRLEFRFKDRIYKCEFAKASDRLMQIATSARPVDSPSATLYRNLLNLAITPPPPGQWSPVSFWIYEVDWNEDEIVDMVRHLNFYMKYFDRVSPHILIHEEPRAAPLSSTPVRFIAGSFPEAIAARQLDPHLLGLWESTLEAADIFRRFLYNYQILEYAAFYHVREGVFQTIKRVISSPDAPTRVSDAARQILDAVVDYRVDDETKLVEVVRQIVDPVILWSEIEANRDFFSRDLEFAGGFALTGLIRTGWGLEDFKAAWIPKFPDSLRWLRNGLVHAREARVVKTIMHTRENYEKLRPWASLASLAANQVMVFGER